MKPIKKCGGSHKESKMSKKFLIPDLIEVSMREVLRPIHTYSTECLMTPQYLYTYFFLFRMSMVDRFSIL